MFDPRFVSKEHMLDIKQKVQQLVETGVNPDAFVYPIFYTDTMSEEIAETSIQTLSDPNMTSTHEDLINSRLPWLRLRDCLEQ